MQPRQKSSLPNAISWIKNVWISSLFLFATSVFTMKANIKDDCSTDFFKFNLFEIKFAGMWVPFKSSPNRKRVLAFNIFYLAYTQVFYTFAELYMLPSMASDMFTLMRLFGIGFTHNLGTFKVCT